MVRCTVLIDGTMDTSEHNFLVVPRRGEAVFLRTDLDSDMFYVKVVGHFAEGATDDQPEPAVHLTLTRERPNA